MILFQTKLGRKIITGSSYVKCTHQRYCNHTFYFQKRLTSLIRLQLVRIGFLVSISSIILQYCAIIFCAEIFLGTKPHICSDPRTNTAIECSALILFQMKIESNDTSEKGESALEDDKEIAVALLISLVDYSKLGVSFFFIECRRSS